MDDEDPSITAGSIVTVTVILKRQNMDVLINKTKDNPPVSEVVLSTEYHQEEEEDQKAVEDTQQVNTCNM